MTWLITEMWLFLLIAFLAGGGFGFWIASARRPVVSEEEAPSPSAAAPSVLLDQPDGEKDDLTQIIGVDTGTEDRLNELGVYHFSQIGSWDEAAQRWIEIRLNEPGRIARERWTEQAMSLLA